ncbi:uncharacterized protein SAPINGB_P005762 [Magnusiomyces paraingens]|uniref:Cytochrome c oxidase assembly protein COX16, mitochondrial n=1 Tax=Magnusiomyces paraingens TaxID=2606893 RepID=A0A5E8C6E6_9ASCO|nr:uncharacterized protein SAPINGB_P005762 [Saprochaete ingens]VVT57571.1 unnamed protein product [Saprochaete ingens]
MIPTLTKLSAFSNKRYMSPKQFEEWKKTPYGKYSTQLKKHPFLLFGLPFMASLFFASLYLSEFTSIRYKNRDERVQMITEEEALKSSSANRRKVDMREEFYRLQQLGDLDDWEQVRVPRLSNESENVWDVSGPGTPDNSAAASAVAADKQLKISK